MNTTRVMNLVLIYILAVTPLAMSDQRQFVEICTLNTQECEIKQIEVKRDDYGNLEWPESLL